jgi:hypothetical protein
LIFALEIAGKGLAPPPLPAVPNAWSIVFLLPGSSHNRLITHAAGVSGECEQAGEKTF